MEKNGIIIRKVNRFLLRNDLCAEKDTIRREVGKNET